MCFDLHMDDDDELTFTQLGLAAMRVTGQLWSAKERAKLEPLLQMKVGSDERREEQRSRREAVGDEPVLRIARRIGRKDQ